MPKFPKGSPIKTTAEQLEEVFPTPVNLATVSEPAVVSITSTRCGGCAFFLTRLDPNNPYDGFCHVFPPLCVTTGFRWAKTASNEFGCGFFKKRG